MPWSRPAVAMDLNDSSALARLCSDGSRLRLLALLAVEELTVAELTAATRLAQSRVSSHLARLREAGWLRVRRHGTQTYHALDEERMSAPARELWRVLRESTGDALLDEDSERLASIIAGRAGGADAPWAESVAGTMERHYSPGRTWEAAARALVGLAQLGHVLDVASGDGALAELVAPRAASVTCVDLSVRVVQAGQQRPAAAAGLRFVVGDMHALPFPGARFDQLMLLNSLSYAEEPTRVVAECARVLKPGGALVAVTLAPHRHEALTRGYGHRQAGFPPDELAVLFGSHGFHVGSCGVTSRERRAPHLAVVTLTARRSPTPAPGGAPTRP